MIAEDSEALPRMDARTAESLVSKWQKIKSQAFGHDHCIDMLPEVRISFHVFYYFQKLIVLGFFHRRRSLAK